MKNLMMVLTGAASWSALGMGWELADGYNPA